MSTHCCFRRLTPILRCSDAAGVARVPKLGQPPQTLDAARAHLDQSPAQLLEPTRADLVKPTDAGFFKVTVDCHGIWERFAAVGSSFPDGALIDLAKVCWARGASVGLE